MDWIQVILLAAAVSFDSLAIGMTYGMAKITIPMTPRLLISVISGLSLFLAMIVGGWIASYFSPYYAEIFGGIILIALGAYSLWRGYQHSSSSTTLRNEENKNPPELEVNPSLIYDFKIPILGLVVQVFKQPLAADYDRSKRISVPEACVLGLVLALDAFAAGIGAAVLGFPPVLTALAVMIASLLFVSKGLLAGKRLLNSLNRLTVQWIPGSIIMIIGLLKLLA